jgi:hypothetical protein
MGHGIDLRVARGESEYACIMSTEITSSSMIRLPIPAKVILHNAIIKAKHDACNSYTLKPAVLRHEYGTESGQRLAAAGHNASQVREP